MEFAVPQKPGKKRRFSFWQHLKSLTGKNKSEQAVANTDVTLVAANKIYSSFRHNTNKNAMLTVSSAVNDVPETYVTLEDSALQNVHRDAGILFLTGNKQLKWKNSEEQEKHVQFAPTPYNKYHTYSSDPRKMKRFGKENSRPALELNTIQQPVLKHPMDMMNPSDDTQMAFPPRNQRTFQEINSNVEKGMASFLPRTSTKSVLAHDDSNLPHFNESSIFQVPQNSLNSSKYNSLKGTNQRYHEKSIVLRESMTESIFPLVESYKKDSGEITKEATVPDEKITHYFVDNALETSKAILQMTSRKTADEPNHTTRYQEKFIRDNLNSCGDSSRNANQSKHMEETLPYFTVYNLEKPHILATNMKANLRRHSFHQHHIQRAGYDGFATNNREDVIHSPHILSQHTILKKAPVTEPPGTISVGKPMSINQNVTQLNDPLIPPFVSLPTTNQKVTLRAHPSKQDSKISCRRSYDPNFLNYLKSRELPLVPENLRIEECITRHTKFVKGLRSSSPNQTNYKNCRRKQKSKYDGVSSMADDECSLNCSCGDCLIDLKYVPKEMRRSYRRGHVKAKLFFPGDKCEDNLIPDSTFRISPTNRTTNVGIVEEPKEEWYTCNDIMCKSPETNHRAANTTKTRNCEENIYANSDVFIADDYEVDHNCQTKDNKTITQVKNKSSLPLSDKLTEAVKTKSTEVCMAEPMLYPQFLDGIELTPRTKKLSQTCISALSDTLANLLQNYKDQPNPSFSISSFNSENESSEKLNTIVIKIQKDDQPKKAEQKPILPIYDHWSVSRNRHSFVLSRSLPELFEDSKLHKETGDETVFKSTMALSPATKNAMKTCESPITNDFCVAKNLTIHEESIEYSEEFPSGWDKSPLAEDTNSGYSTCSLISSTKNSNVSLSSADRELLKDVIKAGMGIQQTPGSKKKFLSTPKIFKVGKFKAKEVLSGKAKLKLSIYYNAGLVTIHIMKAVKLTSVRTLQLNPYVKVSLHPDDSRRVHWRSKVVQSQNRPVFNQKFSFEISPGDSKKRLIFSLWHRDLEKKRSEFLGCMSFGVHRVLDSTQRLNGWYRLLKEVVGTKKHFAASHGKAYAVVKMLER